MGGKTTTGSGRNIGRAPLKTSQQSSTVFRQLGEEDQQKVHAVVDKLMAQLGKSSPALRAALIKKLSMAKESAGGGMAEEQATISPKAVEKKAAGEKATGEKKAKLSKLPQAELEAQKKKDEVVKKDINAAMADILAGKKDEPIASPQAAPVEIENPHNGLTVTTPNESFLLGEEESIMAKKLDEKKGTNPGGIYEGADGKKRYVKLYKEPAQAVGEAVAHAFYNALGIPAATGAWVFATKDGKLGVAADLIDSQGELVNVGLNKDRAQEILQGFAADMLLANWDVVGTNDGYMRNIILGKDGKLHRIDNGGALLYSGLVGKKPAHLLEGLGEWEKFVTTNPSYQEVFKAAGLKGPDEMKDLLVEQARKIQELFDKTDGFKTLVPNIQLNGKDVVAQEDREAMLGILTKKFEHLKKKLGVTTQDLQTKKALSENGSVGAWHKPAEATGKSATSAANVMGKLIQSQQGSNTGGVYQGQDGVTRYVKLYKNPTQAYCEAVASNLYRAMGVGAPEPMLFGHGEETKGVASKMIPEAQELAKVPLTKELAQEVLKGMLADMVLGNRDAVGAKASYLRNVVVDKNGKPFRIDNGGSILFRAMGAEKSEAELGSIDEWDGFADPNKNQGYSDIMKAAGFKTMADAAPMLKQQLAQMQKMFDESDGFETFLPKSEFIAESERAKAVKSMRTRFNLLKQKIQMLD